MLLDAGVAGDVERRIHGAVHHVGAAARHVVDHAVDRLLVAGDDARAEDHGVALFDRDVLVVIDGDAGERRHRLALRAGDQDRDLVGRRSHGVLRAQQDAVGDVEQAERVGDLGDRDHAAADDGDACGRIPGPGRGPAGCGGSRN